MKKLYRSPDSSDVLNFQYQFTQPHPSYGVKSIKRGWNTVHRTLNEKVCAQHMSGSRVIGTLGRWYPQALVIDIDNKPIDFVAQMRSNLGLNQSNSMLFTSESPNSYHLYLKPKLGGRSVTLAYLQQAFSSVSTMFDVEIYPKQSNVIRLPFSRHAIRLDGDGDTMDSIEAMAAFAALDEYDIKTLPNFNEVLLLKPETNNLLFPLDNYLTGYHSWKYEGLSYLNEGLTAYSTRLEATKRVAYYYWSNNIDLLTTKRLVREWLASKHNGFSRDFNTRRNKVYGQCDTLVEWLYETFEHRYYLPDGATMLDKGFISKKGLLEAIKITKGNLPRTRFLVSLASFYQPRRARRRVAVHSDRLIEWSSYTNYLKYIDELKEMGIVSRLSGLQGYKVDAFAKELSLDAIFNCDPHEAVLIDGQRPPEKLEDSLKLAFSANEYRTILKSVGLSRQTASRQTLLLYGSSDQVSTN